MPPDLAFLLTLLGSNYPLSRTYFHGPKGVRVNEALLYLILKCPIQQIFGDVPHYDIKKKMKEKT